MQRNLWCLKQTFVAFNDWRCNTLSLCFGYGKLKYQMLSDFCEGVLFLKAGVFTKMYD